MIGNLTQEEYREELEKEHSKYKEDIKKLLMPEYQRNVLPPIKETLDTMYELKEKKYKIYFLSNLTDATYIYLKDKLNILDDFDGGVYSCKEHFIKPNKKIYEILIENFII